jgi:predicted ArsR family transcriptional regulator
MGMQSDRFFDSARGKIIVALRRLGAATAFDLAREFGLSTNAVRQQLIMMERDGLATGSHVRRGKTKPTVEYKLTRAAEKYFPQLYDRMLNAVLREVRATGGDAAIEAIFTSMARRQAEGLRARAGERTVAERVAALTDLLRQTGVEVSFEKTSTGFRIHEHSCPYALTVAEHPEICKVIHTIMQDTVAPEVRQTESLARGGNECRFEITASGEAQGETPVARKPQHARFRVVSRLR